MTDLRQIWDRAWEHSLVDQKASTQFPQKEWRKAGRTTRDKPNGEDLDFWKEAGFAQLENYVTWLKGTGWKIATIGGQAAIELEVRAEFGGVEILAYPDCLYETPDLLLVDYKTGSRTPTSWMQLCLYAQAIERAFGVRPKLGAYFMTRKGELSAPEPLDRYHDGYFDILFSQLAEARGDGPFLPNLQDHCRTCDVSHACYAYGGPNAALYDPDHPQFGAAV